MKVVVVMPFSEDFDPVYAAISSSVESAVPRDGLTCLRVDEDLKAGRITGKIEDHLRSADICIADISGPNPNTLNPNVMWELGYIEALRKPVVVVTQAVVPLPFNVKDIEVIRYVPGRLDETLARPLTKSIQQTRTTLGAQRTSWTVAITGSRGIVPNKAEYTVRTLASPFLGIQTTWYCGTNGAADYAAARFLLEAKQTVSGVFSTGYNVDNGIRALFALHNASLINADEVRIPRSIPDLGRRDALFVTEADLILLLWDGQSTNIGTFHEWLTFNRKDHLIGNAP